MADQPISLTPGQTVTLADLEALRRQHGGQQSVVARPPSKAEQAAADDAGIDLTQEPIYRYYFADGSYVEARTDSNGQDYHVVDYKPSPKFTQAQASETRPATTGTADSPRVPAGSVPRIEGTPTGQADAQGNPVYDNTRPIRAWHTPDGKVIYEPLATTDPDYLQWQRDKNGGKTDVENQQQQQRDDQTVADVSYTGTGKQRKKITTYKSGRKETEDSPTNATPISVNYDRDGTKVTKYDDGTETRESPPPNEDVPVTVQGTDGKTYVKHTVKGQGNQPGSVYYTDQQGNRAAFPDDKSKAPPPANAPKYTPDWNDPAHDLGLTAYAQQVRSRPDLTKEQQDQLITEAHASATVAAQNANNIVSAQQTEAGRATSERGQNVGMANQRLSASSANFGNALSAAQAATKYSTGPDAAAVLPYYLAMAQATGQAYGGFNNPPAVKLGPAAQAMQDMPGPWGVPNAALAATTTSNAQNATATTDNTIGNILAQPPAGAPDQAGLAAAEAARQQQAAQSAAVPPLSAQPRDNTGPGYPGQQPTAAPAPMAAPAAPTGPMVTYRDRWGNTFTVPKSDFDARPGGNADVTVLDDGSGQRVGMASLFGNGPWQPQQMVPGPTGAGAVAMRSAQGYDPSPVNQALLAAGIDPAIVNLFGGVSG